MTVNYFSNNTRPQTFSEARKKSIAIHKNDSISPGEEREKKSSVQKFSNDLISFSFSLPDGFVEIEIVTFPGIMSHLCTVRMNMVQKSNHTMAKPKQKRA